MVAKDCIRQIYAVSQTFTDFFFWKKGSGEACHYNVVKFLVINISKSFSKKVQTSLPPINKGGYTQNCCNSIV